MSLNRNEPAIIVKAPKRQKWEAAVSQGLELREVKDDTQWSLGELSDEVVNDFGDTSLKQFSKDISIPYNSLREYKRVHIKIPTKDRIPHLSYRHHQIAANTDDPKDWLEKASDEQWSSEYMGLKIKEDRGEELPEKKPTIEKCDRCGKWKLVDYEGLPCNCDIGLKYPIDI